MHPKKRPATIDRGLSGDVLYQKVHSRLGASAIFVNSKKREMKAQNRIYPKCVAAKGHPGGPQGTLGDPQGGAGEPKRDPKELLRQPLNTLSCEEATLQNRCFYCMKLYILASRGGLGKPKVDQGGLKRPSRR